MPVLLAAGAMAGTGRLSLVLVLVLAGIASLVSDVIWYWIGRLGGGRVLGFLCRISLEPDSCVRRTEETFSRRGEWWTCATGSSSRASRRSSLAPST